jgi:hypothetical protein
MSSTPLELAKKLKALADRGATDAERENASEHLERLMKKHKISIDEVDSDVLKLRQFRVKPEQIKIWKQVVSNVVGRGQKVQYNATENIMAIELTNSDCIEIDAKYTFHWHKLIEEQEIFYQAYIQKNELWVKGSELMPPPMNLSEEEMKKLEQMRKIRENLNKHQIPSNNKQIGH